MSDEILKTKATSFLRSLDPGSTECVSISWIQRCKKRHNIISKLMCGESGSVSEDDISEWHKNIIPTNLHRFPPTDIFNGDKTGLFWKLTPHRTLAFVGEKCHGGKHSKERVSVFVMAG